MSIINKYKKFIILAVIIALIAVAYSQGWFGLLTLENLKDNQEYLFDLRDNNYILFVLGYIAVYIISVAFSVPGATVLTLSGGLIFGLLGVVYVLIGASVGATLTAIFTRFLFRDSLEKKFGKQLEGFNKKIDENQVSYLLTLRLLPIFPFFLINILAGLSRVNLRTFFWTTAVGIIPGSFAYVNAGTEISKISSIGDVLSPSLIFSFVLLGLIALIPSFIKKKREQSS